LQTALRSEVTEGEVAGFERALVHGQFASVKVADAGQAHAVKRAR
jgi:hypothetical protein